jgi:hypothetical protein
VLQLLQPPVRGQQVAGGGDIQHVHMAGQEFPVWHQGGLAGSSGSRMRGNRGDDARTAHTCCCMEPWFPIRHSHSHSHSHSHKDSLWNTQLLQFQPAVATAQHSACMGLWRQPSGAPQVLLLRLHATAAAPPARCFHQGTVEAVQQQLRQPGCHQRSLCTV